MRHLAAELCHHGFCHAIQIHPVAGQLRIADGRKAIIIVAGHCHILRHPVAVALEGLHQIVGHLIAVADKGIRHFMGKCKRNEYSPVVPVFEPPVVPDGKPGAQQSLYITEIAVHDGAGGLHAAHKADVPPPGGDEVFRKRIAAAGVVAEHTVGGNGIVVEIQQHKRHAGLHGGGQIPAADLAHEDQAVHLVVNKEIGHVAALFCLRENNLHQHRDVLLGSALEHRPVQIGIKGVLVEKAVRHQNADGLAAGLRLRADRHLIPHFLGGSKNFCPHRLAYAVLAGKPFGNGYCADAQPLGNISHAHCFCHKLSQLSFSIGS